MPEALNVEQFKESLPPRLRRNVNDDLLAGVNKALSDPEFYEQYRNNLLSYTKVMEEGKFKLTSYVDAVRYVSYKLQGRTNVDAYSLTFPEKIQRFATEGVSEKDISSYVSAYNNSKLVALITEQTLVPSWILNQDLYQQALNEQARLMLNAKSEKVRSDAANSILTHLKMPEKQSVELNINTRQDSTIAALRETTQQLVHQQQKMVQSGAMNAAQLGASRLEVIEGEVVDE